MLFLLIISARSSPPAPMAFPISPKPSSMPAYFFISSPIVCNFWFVLVANCFDNIKKYCRKSCSDEEKFHGLKYIIIGAHSFPLDNVFISSNTILITEDFPLPHGPNKPIQ